MEQLNLINFIESGDKIFNLFKLFLFFLIGLKGAILLPYLIE